MNPHIATLERMENAIHTLLLIGDCPLETAPEDVQAEMEAIRAAIALMRGQSERLVAIGHLINTQDNRITDAPIFAVEQKREYVTDADYNDSRIVWINDEGEKAGAKEDAELEARYRRDYEEPRGWRRLAVFDVWEFVTACFTEQGCKDYIAANGHNLKETRIFAHGSYRNREWRDVRDYLRSLPTPPKDTADEQ